MLVAEIAGYSYVRPMLSSRRFSAAAVCLVVAAGTLTATSAAPAAAPEGPQASQGDGATAAKKRCKKGYVRKTVKRGRRRVSRCGFDDSLKAVISGKGTVATITVTFFGPQQNSSCPAKTVTYPAVKIGVPFDTTTTPTRVYGAQGIKGSVRRTAGGGFAYTITAVLGGLEGPPKPTCDYDVYELGTDSFSKIR